MSQERVHQGCPLCTISDGEVLEEYARWRLARTKTMKDHKERLMLFHKEHRKSLDEQSVGEAYLLLLRIGSRFFSYAREWAIFEPIRLRNPLKHPSKPRYFYSEKAHPMWELGGRSVHLELRIRLKMVQEEILDENLPMNWAGIFLSVERSPMWLLVSSSYS